MARLGPFELAVANVEPTVTLLVLVLLMSWLSARMSDRGVLLTRCWALLWCAALGFALLITNHQITGEPLNAFICVLIASELAGYSWAEWERRSSLGLSGMGGSGLAVPGALLVVGLCAPLIGLLLPTLISYSLPALDSGVQWQTFSPEMRLAAPAVSDFRSKDITPRYNRRDDGVWGNYAEFVNEGLDLLRNHSLADESVMALEFSNPFSFSLQRPPAHGGTTCLQFGITFDNTHRLTAERLFGDAKLVMLPNLFSAPLLADAVARLYVEPLRRRYGVVAQSAHWTLYRRIEGKGASQTVAGLR